MARNADLTGDGTWTYAYDLDNRLKTASKTGLLATLAYDAEGRLRQTAIGSTTINLLNDAARLVAEYDAAGTTVLRKYVHGPGMDEPVVWYEGAGTTAKNWLYADHLGSVVATANGTGASTATYSYGPYGEPNVATGLRFRYTGQQLIGELGLYYYKARFYSSTFGRFLQTDPIGYGDDQNLYAYVGNNSANRTDPTGLAGVSTNSGQGQSIFSSASSGENFSWINGGSSTSSHMPSTGSAESPTQVAWNQPQDLINRKNASAFEGGAGGGGAIGGGGARPANYSPAGAGRNGALNEAQRMNGIPTSQQPTSVVPNTDLRGNPQPGRQYIYDVPSPGGGTQRVIIRDDSGGHSYGSGNTQNRGPHFNDPSGRHFDY